MDPQLRQRDATLFSRSLLWIAALALLAASWNYVLAEESAAAESDSGFETATFSMYCYWTGEATLGKVDGVVASRIGHWAGQEIVQVDYDPNRTDVASMVSALQKQKSFYSVMVDSGSRSPHSVQPDWVKRARGDAHFIEPKHSLRTRYPQLAALDLSESQAIALNSWSYFGGPMPDVLTAEQKAQLQEE